MAGRTRLYSESEINLELDKRIRKMVIEGRNYFQSFCDGIKPSKEKLSAAKVYASEELRVEHEKALRIFFDKIKEMEKNKLRNKSKEYSSLVNGHNESQKKN